MKRTEPFLGLSKQFVPVEQTDSKNIPYCYNVIPQGKQKHRSNIYIKLYNDDTDLKYGISVGITLRTHDIKTIQKTTTTTQ